MVSSIKMLAQDDEIELQSPQIQMSDKDNSDYQKNLYEQILEQLLKQSLVSWSKYEKVPQSDITDVIQIPHTFFKLHLLNPLNNAFMLDNSLSNSNQLARHNYFYLKQLLLKDKNIPWIDAAGRVVFTNNKVIDIPNRLVKEDFIDQIVIDKLNSTHLKPLLINEENDCKSSSLGVTFQINQIRFNKHPLILQEIELGSQVKSLIEMINSQFTQIQFDHLFREVVEAQSELSDALFDRIKSSSSTIKQLSDRLDSHLQQLEDFCYKKREITRKLILLIKMLKNERIQQEFLSYPYDFRVKKTQLDLEQIDTLRNIMLFIQLQKNLSQKSSTQSINDEELIEERIKQMFGDKNQQNQFQVEKVQITPSQQCPTKEQKRRLQCRQTSLRATLIIDSIVVASVLSLKFTSDFTLDLKNSLLSNFHVSHTEINSKSIVLFKIHEELTQQALPLAEFDLSSSKDKNGQQTLKSYNSEYECELLFNSYWNLPESLIVRVQRNSVVDSIQIQTNSDPLELDDQPINARLVSQRDRYYKLKSIDLAKDENGLTENEINFLRKDDIVSEPHLPLVSIWSLFSISFAVKRPLNPRKSIPYW